MEINVEILMAVVRMYLIFSHLLSLTVSAAIFTCDVGLLAQRFGVHGIRLDDLSTSKFLSSRRYSMKTRSWMSQLNKVDKETFGLYGPN